MTVVVLGFVAVERVKNSRGKLIDKEISRVFTVRQAADEFVALAKQGDPRRDVWVATRNGSDDA